MHGKEGTSQAKVESPGFPDLTLCFEICLVPDQYDGEVVPVLDSEDLREELAHLIETANEARGVRANSSAMVLLAPPPPCSSHLCRSLMANTSRKPCPARIYCSRMAPNSSWPAVSRTAERGKGLLWGPGSSSSPPAPYPPSTPCRPHCPAGQGCHPRCRSLCRSLQWWGRSRTRSRTGGVGSRTLLL